MTYFDLAGLYPIKSARGNYYILICYDYDSNVILVEALPSISGACVNKGVQKLLDTIATAGPNPKLDIMDKETCYLLKKTLLQLKISYQLVPLHIHIQNAAERAIQT